VDFTSKVETYLSLRGSVRQIEKFENFGGASLLLGRQIWLACPPIYIEIQTRCLVRTSLTRKPKPITDIMIRMIITSYSQSLVILRLPIASLPITFSNHSHSYHDENKAIYKGKDGIPRRDTFQPCCYCCSLWVSLRIQWYDCTPSTKIQRYS
jgi:hypothetical protein